MFDVPVAKTDDTLYFEPTTGDIEEDLWIEEQLMKKEQLSEKVEQFPVRRRSRSVGSKPFTFKKPDLPPNVR